MTDAPTPVAIGVGPVSFDDLLSVARDGAPVRLTDDAIAAVERARGVIDELAAGSDARRTASRPGSARSRPGTSRPRCAPSCSARWCARTPPGPGPEVEREVVRGLMLLRLSTLATGHTGVRVETAQLLAGLLSRRHHAGGPRVRLARLLRRPRAAVALRAGADGRGRGPRRHRHADAGRRGARRCRSRAGRARRQGGSGADQRHRRHARHAGAGDRRPADAAAYGGHRGRDVGRGPARHRPGLRPRAAGDPAASRPGVVGRQPDRAARRTPASSPPTAARTATGSRTPTRCAARRRCTAPPATPSSTPRRSRRSSSRSAVDNPVVLARIEQRSSRTATSTARRSPTCSTSSRSSPPTWRRSASGVPTGSSTRPAATGCRRSSPTTRASTAAT